MDKVVHFEIPIKNYDRAKKFYTELFDWQINEWPGSKFKYGMSTTTPTDKNGPQEPGAINGALMEPTEIFEHMTMITIAVSSIEKYLTKITKAGGKTLMPKSKVGDMGFMARFSDSEGNVVGLWENISK
jgi:uncharacterized protein